MNTQLLSLLLQKQRMDEEKAERAERLAMEQEKFSMAKEKMDWERKLMQEETIRQTRTKDAWTKPNPTEQIVYDELMSGYNQNYDQMANDMFNKNVGLDDPITLQGTTAPAADWLEGPQFQQPTPPIDISGGLDAIMQQHLRAGDVAGADQVSQMISRTGNGKGKSYGPSSLTDALGTKEGAYISSFFPNAQTDPNEMAKAMDWRASQFKNPKKQREYYEGLQKYVKTLADQGIQNPVFDPQTQQWMGLDEMSQTFKPLPGMSGRGVSGTMPEQTSEERTKLAYAGDMMGLNEEAANLWDPSLTGPIQGSWNTLSSKLIDNPNFEALKRTMTQRIILSYQLSGKQMAEKEQSNIIGAFLPSIFQPDANLQATEWALQRFTNANVYNTLKAMEGKVHLTPADQEMMNRAKENMTDSRVKLFDLLDKDKNGNYFLSEGNKISIERAIKAETKKYPGATGTPSGEVDYSTLPLEDLINGATR